MSEYDGRFVWMEHGNIAFSIWTPDGQRIATVGLMAERRLTYVREDELYAKGTPEAQREADERRLLEGRDAAKAWAKRIVRALNAQMERGGAQTELFEDGDT